MDKGIRSGVNWKFNEMLPKRAAIGNKAFRKEILYWAVEEYGITIASACTHYNHSFQLCKKENPTAVEGLGRPPEKNNGGRKKKVAEVVVQGPVLLLGYTPAKAAVDLDVLLQAPLVPLLPEVRDAQQTEFKVCKKADGSVVAEGLSFEDATALVAKAAAAKKARLYWV